MSMSLHRLSRKPATRKTELMVTLTPLSLSHTEKTREINTAIAKRA
jgi:hypothetical protein